MAYNKENEIQKARKMANPITSYIEELQYTPQCVSDFINMCKRFD